MVDAGFDTQAGGVPADRGAGRVFLSYGHRDATDLALRLRADLEAAGHRVWQDAAAIRAGHAWTDEIRDGIRGSDLVVALLSPHSVRRAGWGAGADDQDSVCLDEIEYAVDACRIPVLPVMAVTCEPPFRIYRLQYVDVRDWQESDARYAELLRAVLAAVAQCLQTGRAPVRQWDRLPEPWDFTAVLAERRKRFVGRTWLFEALRQSVTTHPATLLTGSPGVGKSAFVAGLIHANPGGQVLAYHCCQASTPATLSPVVFVRSLAAMIAGRDAGYAALLENPDVVAALGEAAVAADPAAAFDQLVLTPLHHLPAPPAPRILVVDALDEALAWPGSPSIVDLLSSKAGQFPPWLRLVATARTGDATVRRRLRTAQVLSLDEASPGNVRDLAEYVDRRLAEEPLRAAVGARRDEVTRTVLDRGRGNVLVVARTLDALESGLVDLDELASLAPGLEPLYEDFFDRLYRRAGVDFAPTARVLQAVVAAREPPTRDRLAEVTGLDATADLPPLLGRLAALVPPRDGRYAPFHATLTEWLTGWDTETDQPLAGGYHASPAAGDRLWAAHLLDRHDRDQARDDAPDGYLRRYLVSHLVGASRPDDVARVLLDLRFLDAVAAGPGSTVFDLLAAVETGLTVLADHRDRGLLQLVAEILRLDAVFVAEFPESLFQCLWNRGHWHDGPHAAAFLQVADGQVAPWTSDGPRLSELVERWRAQKAARDPHHHWLRALRPQPELLGGALRGIIRADSDGFGTVSASGDGSRLVASQPEAGLLGIWHTRTAAAIATRQLAEGVAVHAVRYVVSGPRAGQIAAGTWDGRLALLDDALETIDEVQVTDDHVSRVAVSPDGALLATADWAGVITLSSAATLEPLHRWKAHDGQVEALEFSPSGRHLASGETSHGPGRNAVRIWSVERPTGPPYGPLAETGSLDWIQSLAFSADGESLFWGDYEGRVERWTWATGDAEVVRDGHDSPAGALLLLPDGRLLCGVGGAFDPVPVEVWDPAARRVERRLDGHLFGIGDLALVPGTSLVVSAGDATLRVWDLGARAIAEVTPREPEVDSLVFAEASGHVITAAPTSTTVWVRRLDDGSLVNALTGHPHPVSALALAPDGRRLAVGDVDGGLHLWDLDRPAAPLWSVRHHTEKLAVAAFTPDGGLVVTGSDDGRVAVVTTSDGSLRRRSQAYQDDFVHTAAVSHDGTLVAVGGYGYLDVLSLPTLDVVRRLPKATHYRVWFGAGDDVVVAEGMSQLGLAWRVTTGERLPDGPEVEALYDVAMQRAGHRWRWSSSGNFGFAQEYLELVDPATGTVAAAFPEVRGELRWHPDGLTWANKRSRQVTLLRLEGGPADHAPIRPGEPGRTPAGPRNTPAP